MLKLALAEIRMKGQIPAARKVYELVQDNDIAPPDVLPQAAAGGSGDNMRTAQGFDGIDIGPVVNLGRRNGMITAVSGQKGHPHTFYGPGQKGRTRVAIGGANAKLLGIL